MYPQLTVEGNTIHRITTGITINLYSSCYAFKFLHSFKRNQSSEVNIFRKKHQIQRISTQVVIEENLVYIQNAWSEVRFHMLCIGFSKFRLRESGERSSIQMI